MTSLYLLEPAAPGAEWAPFAGVRPIAELRAGMWRIRERWEAALDADAVAILGDHVDGFSEGDEPPVRRLEPVDGPAIVAAACFAPCGVRIDARGRARRLAHAGVTVGWIVAEGERWTAPHQTGAALEIDGLPLRGSFDLVTALERLLGADCADLQAAPRGGVPEGSVVLGDPARVVVRGAAVEPGVVFDVRQGAVVLEAGAEVRHGTRLEGPVYVGPGTKVLGGFIRGRRSPGVPGARRDRGERLPRLRQQGPRRLRGPQRRGPLGEPRRAHDDVQPQEHLRAGAARRGGRADRDRTPESGHTLR
jgi:hypothetical protein